MEHVEKRCAKCGKPFIHNSSDIKRGLNRAHCSRRCYLGSSAETSIEKAIRLSLKRLGISFIQEFRVKRFNIDFAIGNIALEADGDYWHSLKRVRQRDKRRDKVLTKLGWKVIRLSETTINKTPNLDALIENIIQSSRTEAKRKSIAGTKLHKQFG
jgi:very-short-patch-repair endonuclease